MPHISVFLLICSMLMPDNGAARVRWMLSGGTGLALVSSKKLPGNSVPVASHHAHFTMLVPMSGNIVLETGIGYERRGFRRDSTMSGGGPVSFYKSFFSYRSIHQYISIPFQLSGCVYRHRDNAVWIGGGMNYGMMMRAKEIREYRNYINDVLYSAGKQETHPPIGLLQVSRAMVRGDEYIGRFRFDVSVKLHATYVLRERYMCRLFYNYGLYDVDASMYGEKFNPAYRQHTTGISLGFIF